MKISNKEKPEPDSFSDKVIEDLKVELIRSEQECKELCLRLAQMRRHNEGLQKVRKFASIISWESNILTGRLIVSDSDIDLFSDLNSNSVTFDDLVERIHDDDRIDFQAAYDQSVKDGKSFEITNRLILPSGLIRKVTHHCMTSLADNGMPLRSIGLIIDITEQKQTENKLKSLYEEIKKSEEKFKSYFNLPLIGIAITSPEKGWLEVNQKLCNIFGYSREELNLLTWSELTHPDDIKADIFQFNRVLSGQIEGYSMDKRFIRKDNETIHASISVRCIRKPNGEVDYFVALIQDISLRIKQEEEKNLRNSRQQLRQLNNRLQNIREEDKKRISREIHDELGQLLTAIKLDMTWLEKRIDVSQTPISDKVNSIYSHVDNSMGTIRRISTDLRPQILDVMGFCKALESEVDKFSKNLNISCQLRIEPEEIRLQPELATDLFRISQEALTNISRHSQASNVHVEFFEHRHGYELCVRDNGIGFHSSRLDNLKSLGLVGIRERVLIWNGTFEINGVVGEGTLLKVDIPKL